jgi:hypothetical protein
MANPIVTPAMIDTESEWFKGADEAYKEAFYAHSGSRVESLTAGVIAVLAYIANNPIKPSGEQSSEVADAILNTNPTYAAYATEWQRRMFLRREPEVPAIVVQGEWPSSTCVECGKKMESGRFRKCSAGGEMGSGNCTWRIPAAISEAIERGKKIGGAH